MTPKNANPGPVSKTGTGTETETKCQALTYHGGSGSASADRVIAGQSAKKVTQHPETSSESHTGVPGCTIIVPQPPSSKPPSWLHNGARVTYSPILGGRRFLGTVRGEPFALVHGAVVAHLRDMEPAYGAFVGLPGRSVVHAALLEALAPCECLSWRAE